MKPILTSETIRLLHDTIKKEKTEAIVSLDLGRSTQKVTVDADGLLIDGTTVSLPPVRKKDKSCYRINEGTIEKIQYISDETGHLYKLVPTHGKPLLKISATSMHKKPFIDRIASERLQGNILDAGTGLGYTAIEASKTAKQVTTVEHDGVVLGIAQMNPYSQRLFTDKSITVLKGDITDLISTMQDESFDTIIFDAGTPAHSSHFFSNTNYKHAYRVLKQKGRLFHYLPRPQLTKGRDFISEVERRLQNIGFETVERNEEGSYLIVRKN